jgi:hypothetical protein
MKMTSRVFHARGVAVEESETLFGEVCLGWNPFFVALWHFSLGRNMALFVSLASHRRDGNILMGRGPLQGCGC